MTAQNLAIYIHWPYCVSKCPYCDFNSHVASSIDHDVWREAYRREIAHYAEMLPDRRIASVFFGGGTPSLMQPQTVGAVLEEIARHWPLAEGVEITLEANPNSVEAEKFVDFRAAGVNRLSLGVQSLKDEALKFLGRAHDAAAAQKAIVLAARHFPRFSFDLIYARQDQSLASWQAELQDALALAGDHLSLYQLTIEPGTQFHTRAGRGEALAAPSEESAAMFELTQQLLETAGLPSYEISNHARPGFESRHNLTYWHYEDYIGIGPGAHGRCLKNGKRFASENHKAPDVWLAQVKERGEGLRVWDEIDSDTAKREALMMGLRLTDGIDRAGWTNKFGAPIENFLSAEKIAHLVHENYLVSGSEKFKATASGRQRLNALLDYLVA